MQQVNAQEAIKDQAARLSQEEKDFFEKKHKEDFSIDLFQMYDRYLERLEAETAHAQKVLDGMQPQLRAAMEKVLEARRRRRVVELIRDRQAKEHARTQRKIQARELAFLNRRREGLFEEDAFNAAIVEELKKQQPDEEEEFATRERDLIAEYYKNMGMEDPRKK